VTSVRIALVDVYVFRGAAAAMEVLLLRRARGPRAGSWEAVHGHIEPGEMPVAAARREFAEETGCRPEAFFNLSAVEQFYLHDSDEVVLIPVFAARVAPDAAVVVGHEHDQFRWLSPADARALCTWPRAVRAIEAIERLLGTGDGGVVDGVLRLR
jgi:dihydroneopterin triphosphate diphosphatase